MTALTEAERAVVTSHYHADITGVFLTVCDDVGTTLSLSRSRRFDWHGYYRWLCAHSRESERKRLRQKLRIIFLTSITIWIRFESTDTGFSEGIGNKPVDGFYFFVLSPMLKEICSKASSWCLSVFCSDVVVVQVSQVIST